VAAFCDRSMSQLSAAGAVLHGMGFEALGLRDAFRPWLPSGVEGRLLSAWHATSLPYVDQPAKRVVGSRVPVTVTEVVVMAEFACQISTLGATAAVKLGAIDPSVGRRFSDLSRVCAAASV
jgi:hypothetical protein